MNQKSLLVLLKLHKPQKNLSVFKCEQYRHIQGQVWVGQISLPRFLPEKVEANQFTEIPERLRQQPGQSLFREVKKHVFEIAIVRFHASLLVRLQSEKNENHHTKGRNIKPRKK